MTQSFVISRHRDDDSISVLQSSFLESGVELRFRKFFALKLGTPISGLRRSMVRQSLRIRHVEVGHTPASLAERSLLLDV